MAEAMLRRLAAEAGVEARVHSAGLLGDGDPASTYGVEVLEAMGLDTSGHLSRRMTAEMVAGADLVIAMAREHLREAVVAVPDAFPRTFTLKELVRRGEAAGPRSASEPLDRYLARLHEGRDRSSLLGVSDEDDVSDPYGTSLEAYRQTAAELDDLTRRLAALLWTGGT